MSSTAKRTFLDIAKLVQTTAVMYIRYKIETGHSEKKFIQDRMPMTLCNIMPTTR